MLELRIRKHRGKDEPKDTGESPATGDEPASEDDDDRFASMGQHIASLMRTADEAAHRVAADADRDAQARIAEATEQAAGLVSDAETQASARRAEAEKQARGVLDEATELLDQARERGREIRRQADAYAEARRVEHAELIAQATRDRDQATAVMAGARRVLGEIGQELGERIDHATQSLGKLTEMQGALSRLEAEHAGLADIGADTETTPPGDSGDDDVIDLTDSDDKLDDDLRKAKDGLEEQPSPKQEPATGSP